MPYIYEMDVALLRMQYLLPFNFHIHQITTVLSNQQPYDRTNINIFYQAEIQETYIRFSDGNIILDYFQKPLTGRIIKVLRGESLQELVNQCRIWSILRSHEQTPVDNSPQHPGYFTRNGYHL